MFGNKKLSSLVSLLVIAVTILSACATPTPQVVEKEVVVEKPVIETVIVEKEVVVEKPVVETVIVEKEVEVVVTATPEPTQPMVIVIAIGIDPVNLDQRRLQVSEAQPLADMINEPMISRDDKGNLVPNLAESWDWTKDTELTIHLRKGIAFENGEPFDAEAVKYTLESVLDPANTWVAPERRGWLEPIERIDTPDPVTVVITLKEVNVSLPFYLSYLGIVPPKAAEAASEGYGNAPIGTGPYSLVEYVPGSHLELKARKDYWGDPPKNDTVIVRFLSETATRMAALEAGEVHVIQNAPPDTLKRIKENDELKVINVSSCRQVFISFMTDRPPFDNKDLRHAVSHAIDRQAIVDIILGGYGEVAQSMYPPGVAYWKAQEPYEYSPEKARELIAKSGFDTSQTLKFAYPTGRTINDKEAAEAMAAMMEEVGLKLELSAPEWGTYLEEYQRQRIYDFVVASMGAITPDYQLFPWFRSDTSFIKYSNPQVDEWLRQGATTFDLEEQKEIYQKLQEFLWDDLPNCPIYVVPQLWAKSKNLEGFQLLPQGDWYFRDAVVVE